MFYGEHDVDDVRGDGVVFQDIPVHEVGGFVYQSVVRNVALAGLSRNMIGFQNSLVVLLMVHWKVLKEVYPRSWKRAPIRSCLECFPGRMAHH